MSKYIFECTVYIQIGLIKLTDEYERMFNVCFFINDHLVPDQVVDIIIMYINFVLGLT